VEIFEKLKNWPLYPFLFALFPILFLLANNASEVRPIESIRAIVLALLCTLLLLVLFRLIMSGWEAASLITTIVVVMLFSYGHLYHSLRDLILGGSQIIRHRFFLPAIIILIIFALWIIRRNRSNLSTIPQYLNVVSLVLLVMSIFQIAKSEVHYQRETSAGTESDSLSCNLSAPAKQAAPDIYYIILDAYTRDDVLRETYNFDNGPFLDELREQGFYIAEKSQSNYASTIVSLTSSLNMDYLIDHSKEDSVSYAGYNQEEDRNYSIGKNSVRRELECLGYKVVSLDSGRYYSSWRDADYYLSPHKIGVERYYLASLNEFESTVLDSSIGLIFMDVAILRAESLLEIVDQPFRDHRERILFALELGGSGVLNLPSPKFVFIHVISPHAPYIFSAGGDIVDQSGPFTLLEADGNVRSDEIEGYRNQVDFINGKLIEMVRDIKDSSETPPIIIIQGDHGSLKSIRDRMAILNAYHLPDGGNQRLYENITPVNSFRTIFNYYFRGSFALLEDQSFFSDHDAIYDFIEVPIHPD
jgi:hypothetical protein